MQKSPMVLLLTLLAGQLTLISSSNVQNSTNGSLPDASLGRSTRSNEVPDNVPAPKVPNSPESPHELGDHSDHGYHENDHESDAGQVESSTPLKSPIEAGENGGEHGAGIGPFNLANPFEKFLNLSDEPSIGIYKLPNLFEGIMHQAINPKPGEGNGGIPNIFVKLIKEASKGIPFKLPKPLQDVFNSDGKLSKPDGETLDPLDHLLQDVLPSWYGQRPNNENGTKAEYKDYNLKDDSNDDAWRLSGQEIITRSGYKYELYDALADDGYITQLTRLINPLVDRYRLRQPPVLMLHGGTIDPTAYIVASSIQHFPEKWPRVASDGPIKSWNRSLAFLLANHGFDVWLAETRGANDRNRRRLKAHALKSVLEGRNKDKNMTIGENVKEVLGSVNYWSFTMDDIIAHELKSHIDTVLKWSGAKKVHLMTFSMSTPTSLAFLGMRPDYARKVQGFISMAPIISGQGASKLTKFIFHTACPLVPDHIGALVFTDIFFTQPTRDLIVLSTQNKEIRYSIAKAFTTALMGASAKYQTLLDSNILGHLMRSLSFRELKQMCQHVKKNKLQKFDYGPVRNKLIYKQVEPPIYDISNLQIKDWIVVAAANDALSTPQVIEHLFSLVNPKPTAYIIAPGFNHLDLFAGWENDKYVNLPILLYLEKMSFIPGTSGEHSAYDDERASGARGLSTIFPPGALNESLLAKESYRSAAAKLLADDHLVGAYSAVSTARSALPIGGTNSALINPATLLEGISSTVRLFMSGLGGTLENLFANKGDAGSVNALRIPGLDLLPGLSRSLGLNKEKDADKEAGQDKSGDGSNESEKKEGPLAEVLKKSPVGGDFMANFAKMANPAKLMENLNGLGNMLKPKGVPDSS